MPSYAGLKKQVTLSEAFYILHITLSNITYSMSSITFHILHITCYTLQYHILHITHCIYQAMWGAELQRQVSDADEDFASLAAVKIMAGDVALLKVP